MLLLVGGALAWGCFIEITPPPAARYTCDSDAECDDDEVCASGLCQVPCTMATFNSDCDQSKGYAACFNGYCAHLCEVEASECTSPQVCLSLGISLNLEGATSGVCGIDCGASGCPEGEACTAGGVCLAACDETNPTNCASDEICSGGVCVPSSTQP
jgi:hypothetical protein